MTVKHNAQYSSVTTTIRQPASADQIIPISDDDTIVLQSIHMIHKQCTQNVHDEKNVPNRDPLSYHRYVGCQRWYRLLSPQDPFHSLHLQNTQKRGDFDLFSGNIGSFFSDFLSVEKFQTQSAHARVRLGMRKRKLPMIPEQKCLRP